jgi:hypothetical protein
MQSLLTGIFHRRLEIPYEILLTFFIILIGANVFLHSYVNLPLLCFALHFFVMLFLCFAPPFPAAHFLCFAMPFPAARFLCISLLDVANLHHFNAAQLKTLP